MLKKKKLYKDCQHLAYIPNKAAQKLWASKRFSFTLLYSLYEFTPQILPGLL